MNTLSTFSRFRVDGVTAEQSRQWPSQSLSPSIYRDITPNNRGGWTIDDREWMMELVGWRIAGVSLPLSKVIAAERKGR